MTVRLLFVDDKLINIQNITFSRKPNFFEDGCSYTNLYYDNLKS